MSWLMTVMCCDLFIFPKVITELGNSENKVSVISSLHSSPLKPGERHAFQFKKQELHSSFKTESDVNHYPVLLWWSPLTGETGRFSQCGEDVCFFTINKTYQHNHMTRAFLFYGKNLFVFKEVAFPPLTSSPIEIKYSKWQWLKPENLCSSLG